MIIQPKPIIHIEIKDDCISEGFRLTKFDEIPCAYCGKEMITQKTLDGIFDYDGMFGTELLEKAREYGDILPSFQKEIINRLTQTQYLEGLTTDNQILKSTCCEARKEVRKDIALRFDEIADIIENSDDKRLKSIMKGKQDIFREALIKKCDYKELMKFVRSYKFLDISVNSEKEVNKKINAVVEDIEKNPEISTDYYLSKKGYYTSPRDFFIELFEKATSSVDHIIAKAKGGSNRRNNFLAVCRNCNGEKKDMPFSLFIQSRPEVKQNIIRQIQLLRTLIPKLIAEHKLEKEYEDYTDAVSEKLRIITKGDLDIRA